MKFGRHMVQGLDIGGMEYEELDMWELNGWQIKNVLVSNQALASNRGDQINITDLRTVVQALVIPRSQLLSRDADNDN